MTSKQAKKERTTEYKYPSMLVRSRIMNDIKNGELLPGERLPGERKLAENYGVSRMAVQYALKQLEQEGVVERRKGAGTFISKITGDKVMIGDHSSSNLGITSILKNSGHKISNRVIAKGFVSSKFLAHKLGIPEEEKVYALHRVRFSNDEPFALEYSYLPARLFPDIETVDFTDVSLYDYMESYGLMSEFFNETLQLVEVNSREAGYLEMAEGDPVYYNRLVGFSGDGRIVEYTESYSRCDKAEIKFDTVV